MAWWLYCHGHSDEGKPCRNGTCQGSLELRPVLKKGEQWPALACDVPSCPSRSLTSRGAFWRDYKGDLKREFLIIYGLIWGWRPLVIRQEL